MVNHLKVKLDKGYLESNQYKFRTYSRHLQRYSIRHWNCTEVRDRLLNERVLLHRAELRNTCISRSVRSTWTSHEPVITITAAGRGPGYYNGQNGPFPPTAGIAGLPASALG